MIKIIFILLALLIFLLQLCFLQDKLIVLFPQFELKNTVKLLETGLFYLPLLCIMNTFLGIGIIYVILISASENPSLEVKAVLFLASLVLYFMVSLTIGIIFNNFSFPYAGFIELFNYILEKLKISLYIRMLLAH